MKLLSKTDKLELVSSVVQEIKVFFQFMKLLLNFDCICMSTSESNKEVLQAPSYKTIFMLNSTEHEFFTVHEC